MPDGYAEVKFQVARAKRTCNNHTMTKALANLGLQPEKRKNTVTAVTSVDGMDGIELLARASSNDSERTKLLKQAPSSLSFLPVFWGPGFLRPLKKKTQSLNGFFAGAALLVQASQGASGDLGHPCPQSQQVRLLRAEHSQEATGDTISCHAHDILGSLSNLYTA